MHRVYTLELPLVKLICHQKKPSSIGHFDNPQVLTAEAIGNGNVGVICGHGVVVIDVDVKNGASGLATLGGLQAALGRLPGTLTARTPSGGYHYYFRCGERLPNFSEGGIDFQAYRKYVVAPPSSLPEGVYEWEDDEAEIASLPSDWLAFWRQGGSKGMRATPLVTAPVVDPAWIPGMLAVLDPDLPRELWIRVGMALHAAGDHFDKWDKWSARGTKYPGTDELKRQWASFSLDKSEKVSLASLAFLARQAGWEPARAPQSVSTFDVVLPGAWKGLYDLCLEHAEVPVPQFAFAASAAVVSASFQGRWVTPGDAPLSLYQLIAGPPGAGKDRPQQFVAAAMQEMAPNRLLGDFASAQGLFAALETEPNRVAVIDEMGKWLLDAVSARGESASIGSKMMAMLLKLSQSHGSLLAESSKENTKGGIAPTRRVAENPRLSFFGTMTAAQLKSLLAGDRFVSDGLFSRTHFWPVMTKAVGRSVPQVDPLRVRHYVAELVNPVNRAGDRNRLTGGGLIPDDRIQVESQLCEERQTRRALRITRWASLHALASQRREVRQSDLDWGYSVEVQETRLMRELMRSASDSKQLDRAIESVNALVKAVGPVTELMLVRAIPSLKDLDGWSRGALLRDLRSKGLLVG